MHNLHKPTLRPIALTIIILVGLLTTAACQAPPRNLQPLRSESAVTRLAVTATPEPKATEQAQRVVTATPSPAPNQTDTPPTAVPPACPEATLSQHKTWCYLSAVGDVFIHPISFVTNDTDGYLLDSGRVFQIPLDQPAQPRVLLAPGQFISGTKVIEPLDITLTADHLFTLDRAGDVYRYTLDSKTWTVDRYDRPIRDLSSHYFLTITADQEQQYILETSYSFGLAYGEEQNERLWRVPEGYLVDLAIAEENFYTLYRPYTSTQSVISHYQDGIYSDLSTEIEITQPRQLETDGEALYLLDEAGKRLTQLSFQGGQQQVWSFPEGISSFALHQDHILLTNRNTIYWLDEQIEPEQTAILSAAYITAVQPNDPNVLANLPAFILPIPNLPIAGRDLRLPGAPRHYRLGVHEGVDFYWGPGREILAVNDGTIIRLIEDYTDPTEGAFNYWRNQALTLGYTPEKMLDFYRGRQIWIAHDGGWISRYAHLSETGEGLGEGDQVSQGDLIGRVGNSGSPASQESDSADSHLHFELWLGDFYLGQFLRPIETREILETLFE